MYVCMYVWMDGWIDGCTYEKFTSLFFCVYHVHISLGQKMLKMKGLKKDRMEGDWQCSSGVVCGRGIKYSPHYVKVKADWYVATRDSESMSFYYFFISFRLKRKLSQWPKIVMPDLNDFLDFEGSQRGKPGAEKTFIKWKLSLLTAKNSQHIYG